MSSYKAIFDYYPVSKETLPIVPSITLETFKMLPQVKRSYFETGFDAKTTYRAVRKNLKMQFPKSYDIKTPVKTLKAPTNKILALQKKHSFKFVITAAKK